SLIRDDGSTTTSIVDWLCNWAGVPEARTNFQGLTGVIDQSKSGCKPMAQQYIHLARALGLIELDGATIHLTQLGSITQNCSEGTSFTPFLNEIERVFILAILLFLDGHLIGRVIEQLYRAPGR